jgi:hypothetical protein
MQKDSENWYEGITCTNFAGKQNKHKPHIQIKAVNTILALYILPENYSQNTVQKSRGNSTGAILDADFNPFIHLMYMITRLKVYPFVSCDMQHNQTDNRTII